jgi:hypothetical protein
MKRSSSARRAMLVAVAASMLLALLPAAPAAAATPSWSLNSTPVSVRGNDGNTYKMTIYASDGGESTGEYLSITLMRTRNPDGTGPLAATQTAGYSFNITGNRFTHPEANLSRAGLDTATEMGVYGKLDLNFAADRALQRSCNDHVRTRAGVLRGTVSFKTGTPMFGTITARPGRATMYWDDGAGDCGFQPPTNACPGSYRSMGASRYSEKPLTVSATKRDGASTANVSAYSFGDLLNNEGSLFRYVSATLPASKFALGNTLRSGSVSGAAGTYLSGTMTYTASQPTSTSPAVNCGTSKEYVGSSSAGNATGGFKVDFFVGPDRAVNEAPMDYANASRTVTRAR